MSHACACATKCAQQCHCRDYVVVKPLYLPRSQSASFCHEHNNACRRPWHNHPPAIKDGGSTVSQDQDKFQVNLDVSHFKAEELTVKITTDNLLIVEGQHEEKEDEQGYISRHFVRKYTIPAWSDPNRIESKISSDGVLTVTAPKVDYTQTSRNIPIMRMDTPKVDGNKIEENCPCTE